VLRVSWAVPADPAQYRQLHDWYHHLYDTHPPIEERIAELEKIASGQSV